jgi:hypothetical protein
VGKKSKKLKKAKQTCSVLLWHKTYNERIRQRFGLSKYQMLCITFVKDLLIGYFLALALHSGWLHCGRFESMQVRHGFTFQGRCA